MANEIKKHPRFTHYGADVFGNIYSLKFGKVKLHSQSLHGRGYLHFTALQYGDRKSYLSHRFVYECFYGMIDDGMQINHIDCDKHNNQLSNLQVVDQWENMRHGKQNGVQYGAASPNYSRIY